jgi:hypothetical protein
MNWVSPFVVMKTIFSFPYFGLTQAHLSASGLCEYLGMPSACTGAAQSAHITLKSDEVGQAKAVSERSQRGLGVICIQK